MTLVSIRNRTLAQTILVLLSREPSAERLNDFVPLDAAYLALCLNSVYFFSFLSQETNYANAYDWKGSLAREYSGL